jgi:purine-binding chemotaxis protein CheW
MDLADIRKKAKLQRTPKTAENPDPDTFVSGAPETEFWSPETEPMEESPEVALPLQNAIDELFSNPFQIDAIEGGDSLDLVKKDREDKRYYRQWLSFSLCQEEYAIELDSVSEIIKPREITDIPRVPDFILGIISLRGIIVPIYDLARRLSLGSVVLAPQSRIVVCQEDGRIIGLLVDSITQVVRISEKNIEAPPAVLADLDRDFVSGVGRYQGRMLILLKLRNVFNPELS